MERYERTYPRGFWDHMGKFARIFTARDRQTDDDVVIKRVRHDCDAEAILDAKREVSILRELSGHDNVVQLKDCIDDPSCRSLFLVFERLDYDLKHVLWTAMNGTTVRGAALDPRKVKSYLRQACRGLAFCHERGILHRDVKPSHMLLSKGGVLKLADFGLSRSLRDEGGRGPPTHEVVTLWYRPPEILLGSATYGAPIDVWSLGCVFAELATGRPLFPGCCEVDQLYRIFRQLGTPREGAWPGVTGLAHWNAEFPRWFLSDFHEDVHGNVDPLGCELLEMFLMCNPSDRITAKDALDHPYFDKNGWDE